MDGVIVLVLFLGVYFVPCIVAGRRNHSNAVSIFVLNLFLGWTFVGWVAAMVWAMSDNVKKETAS